MIEYIKGDIAEITPTDLVLETNGIGYGIHISLNTYSALNGKHNAKLYIYEVIREDTHELYGFAEKEERTVFLALISVSGVGSNTARMILSSYNPNELQTIIASEKVDALKAVKGIGLKTAQRIIIDLKDKLKLTAGATQMDIALPAADQTADEAVSALIMLGFAKPASQKAVTAILKATPTLTVEQVIKTALRML